MSFDVPVAPKFDTCFAINCRMCNSQNFVKVVESDFNAWRNGEFIQNALPYLDANQRELLMTQICGTCFDALPFGEQSNLLPFGDNPVKSNQLCR